MIKRKFILKKVSNLYSKSIPGNDTRINLESNEGYQTKSEDSYCNKLVQFFRSPLTIYVYDHVFH
jgi:hypothetical protein